MFSFEDHAYNKFLNWIGLSGSSVKIQVGRVVLPFVICWVPLAIYTLFQGSFWTGDVSSSFITDFNIQARFFVTMPILIFTEKIISARLGRILEQFVESGIVDSSQHEKFKKIIKGKSQFLKSNWTDIVVFVLVYIQVFSVIIYESEYTKILTWQLKSSAAADPELNFAGMWSVLVSLPFILFLFYRWLLRIIVWGLMLRSISKLKLILSPAHPDLVGGLGFLGYAMSYFSPIAFAISATVAGKMSNFVQIEGSGLSDLKYLALGYILFISILFTLPMLFFTRKLIDAREDSVFENYDFANGMYRELRKTLSKGYEKVSRKDLESVEFSAVADLNAVIENALNMKFLAFTIKDMIPLWVMTILPFIAVIAMKIPLSEMFLQILNLVV